MKRLKLANYVAMLCIVIYCILITSYWKILSLKENIQYEYAVD